MISVAFVAVAVAVAAAAASAFLLSASSPTLSGIAHLHLLFYSWRVCVWIRADISETNYEYAL